MATRLRKLKITRVAVCEKGANPDADILLFKAAASLPDTPVVVPGRRVSSQERPPLVLKQDHAEPDGDEAPPMDYATRSRQTDLWRALWEKWERFVSTYYDITADCDADNVPHLPLLVDSIGQFQDDVASLLTDLGIVGKAGPALDEFAVVAKAGAAMAGHRLTRLKAAIDALQAIFVECTPPEIEHEGISAAEAAGIPGAVNGRVPGQTMIPMTAQKGVAMADKDLGVVEGNVAQQELEALRKRAEAAEARVQELEPLALRVTDLETTIAKMNQTPEEQEAEYLASLPERVRKRYEVDQLEKVELRKRVQDADERAERTEYIQKTAQYRNVGMVPDDHWAILKAIDGMPEAQRDELLRLLKAANEQLQASSLFAAAGVEGRSAQGTDGSGSAESQIMGLAQAYATDKGVMLDKAIEAIAKAHPDLWARDQQEKRHNNRVNSR